MFFLFVFSLRVLIILGFVCPFGFFSFFCSCGPSILRFLFVFYRGLFHQHPFPPVSTWKRSFLSLAFDVFVCCSSAGPLCSRFFLRRVLVTPFVWLFFVFLFVVSVVRLVFIFAECYLCVRVFFVFCLWCCVSCLSCVLFCLVVFCVCVWVVCFFVCLCVFFMVSLSFCVFVLFCCSRPHCRACPAPAKRGLEWGKSCAQGQARSVAAAVTPVRRLHTLPPNGRPATPCCDRRLFFYIRIHKRRRKLKKKR